MAEIIPFIPGDPNQRLDTVLAGEARILEARWNANDHAWYLNVRDADNTMIAAGLKIVLGARLGWSVLHPMFVGRALFAVDLSNTGLEAGLDDFGSRVRLVYFTESDLALAARPLIEAP